MQNSLNKIRSTALVLLMSALAPFGGCQSEGSGSIEDTAGTGLEVATVAGGCFWGVEDLMRRVDGVVDTEVGYSGGTISNPTYEMVSTGETGHAESVRIVFDPEMVSFRRLLDYFFETHDPTLDRLQTDGFGSQYRSAVFYHSESQKLAAEHARDAIDASGKWPRPVVTEISPAGQFWPAEEYHQDYLQKHPR